MGMWKLLDSWCFLVFGSNPAQTPNLLFAFRFLVWNTPEFLCPYLWYTPHIFSPSLSCFKWIIFLITSYYHLVSKKDATDRGPWSPREVSRRKGRLRQTHRNLLGKKWAVEAVRKAKQFFWQMRPYGQSGRRQLVLVGSRNWVGKGPIGS